MQSLLTILLVTYLALLAIAYFLSERMIFQPPPATYTADRLPIEWVETGDGARLAVLHLPNPDARYTILYSHGNAEDLGMVVPALERLREAGFAVIGYDYHGYGASSGGPPTVAGAERDAEAVFRYATETLRIPPDRIVPYGFSVGSGLALHIAAREPVAGVIVENGFVSAFRVVTRVPLLPFDRFPNLKRIRGVKAPVLVIHGTHDRIVPFSHGRMLYAAAAEPKRKLWVEGGTHGDVAYVAGDAYWRALRDFVALLEATDR